MPPNPHLLSLFGGRYPSSSCQHVGLKSDGTPLHASSLSASRSTTCRLCTYLKAQHMAGSFLCI